MRQNNEKNKLKAFKASEKLSSCATYIGNLVYLLIVVVIMLVLAGPPLVANYVNTLVASGDWTHHEEPQLLLEILNLDYHLKKPIDDAKDFKRFGIDIDIAKMHKKVF